MKRSYLALVMLIMTLPAWSQIRLPKSDNIPTFRKENTIIWPEALITVPEKTSYLNTSTYAEVMEVVNYALSKSNQIKMQVIGQSDSGVDIPLLILSKNGVSNAQEAKASGLGSFYIQANIHGGEVEGKEAVLILMREILFGHKQHLLDNQIILITPVYNIDGNDNMGDNTRPSQEGSPITAGTRANGAGLDLNRDGVKMEAKETRALMQKVINEWDPLLLVDLHTTNGTWHGYSLTWAPAYHTVGQKEPYDFTWNTMLPEITETVFEKYNVMMGPFGDYYGLRRWPVTTFSTYNHHPRYLVNMMGVRNRLGILSEGFAHERFYQRIHSTHSFITEILEFTNLHAREIMALTAKADEETTRLYKDQAGKAKKGVRFDMVAMDEPLTLRTYDYGTYVKENGDTLIFRKPYMVNLENVTYRAKFNPSIEATIPRGYVIPQNLAHIAEFLMEHGVKVEKLDKNRSFEGESFYIEKVERAPRKFEGHNMATLVGDYKASRKTFRRGDYFVDAAQPLGNLIFYLLEPQSDDGLATWNFLDEAIGEGGKEYPIFKYFK